MQYRLPSLNGLQAFEAAARHENFARAAEELNLSQATVSHRVRMLERDLGYMLFERLPRGLRLTESGKAYVPSIRKSFEQIFSSTTGLFGRKSAGSLTVRAPISYTSLWLSPIIDSFLNRYPGIDVRLISTVWADELANDETDIDFRLGYGSWKNCRAELVLKERVVPVCRPGLISSCRNNLTCIADLLRFSLIHVMGIEDLWMNYFALEDLDLGIDRRDVRVDSVVSALEITSSSDRIALLQKRFVKPWIESGRLVQLLDVDMAIEQAIYSVQPYAGAAPKPEAILFHQWLHEQTGVDDDRQNADSELQHI